jgi:hypothetical protein
MSPVTAKVATASGEWRWTLATSVALVIFVAGLFKYQQSVIPMIAFILVVGSWMARSMITTGWIARSKAWLRFAQILTIASPLALAFIASDDDVFVNLRTGETSLSGMLVVLPFVTPIAHIPIKYSIAREQPLVKADGETSECGISFDGFFLDVRDPKAVSNLVTAHAAMGHLKTFIPSGLRTTMDEVLADILKRTSMDGERRPSGLYDDINGRVQDALSSLHLRPYNGVLRYVCDIKLKDS